MSSKDPYKYFRTEARDILEGLNKGILILEKEASNDTVLSQLLRLTHTLKGAARVVKQNTISDLAHTAEGILSPYRDSRDSIPNNKINEVLHLLDEIAYHLKALETHSNPEGSRKGIEETFESIRLDISEMDTLLGSISEAIAQMSVLTSSVSAMGEVHRVAIQLNQSVQSIPSQGSGLGTHLSKQLVDRVATMQRDMIPSLERMGRELNGLQGQVAQLRLLPASTVFPVLQRAARDVADSLGKKIVLETGKGAIRLDPHVLSGLQDALVQLIRNAVVHGIESVGERLKLGKSPSGKLELKIEKRGNRVAFVFSDDGRGIDLSALKEIAVQRGLVSAERAEAMGLKELTPMILRGGLSTTSEVSQVAGRGVGMDLVREKISQMKGEIRLHSSASQGTHVELIVPLSLESVVVLGVSSAETQLSVPFDAVKATFRLSEEEIVRNPIGDSVFFAGQSLPFMVLNALWGRRTSREQKKWSVVVLAAGNSLVALGCEAIVGTQSVVVRPLPAGVAGQVPLFSGAFFDVEGTLNPVLDPEAFAKEVLATKDQWMEQKAAPKTPILVIDDSLTTRMLEQSVLESAGYAVDLVTSGEDALKRAHESHYALFVVDVEMPGMDGYEFVRCVKADNRLSAIPVVMVTSRASVEDRRRGADAGACGYINKAEFEEAQFLRTIRSAIG